MPRLPAGQEWQPVRLGESGDRVFRRSDGAAHVKVSEPANAALLESERDRTEWLAAFGLGSPRVLDWIESEEGACLVTSTVAGVPASELASAELGVAWPSIIGRVRDLHAVPASGCPFARDLATMFARAEDVVRRNAVNPDFLAPEQRDVPPADMLAALRAQLPVRLDQEKKELVVCHGDACMPNFMVDPQTLRCTGMIDLGRLGVADRYVDFSLLIANSSETWSGPEEAKAAYDRLFSIHAIPQPDRERLAFYLGLDPLTWG
ncbi:MAG: APH(3'') family aminoglycoside O-phosphotransferase [Shinella sp.]|nr:APH(3'') family aminoglycoside O-phosphotransferase [Shinella sp.]